MGLLLVLGIISAVLAFLLWAYGGKGWEGFAALAFMIFVNTLVKGTVLSAICEKAEEQESESRQEQDKPVWAHIPSRPQRASSGGSGRTGHRSLFI